MPHLSHNILSSISKTSKHTSDLFTSMLVADKRPVFIVGLPRTGTTWITSILNTAPGIKYFHEPFNPHNVPGATTHWMKYLRAEDEDYEFSRHCSAAFDGRNEGPYLRTKLSSVYKRFPWWPGRFLIKDVHSIMALDWIDREISPVTVIVLRHPCAVAASWLRLKFENERTFQLLLNQPKLIHDYLKPFENLLNSAREYSERTGAIWGATYHVILQQWRTHPHWIVVEHESFCRDPVGQYRDLFKRLGLHWGRMTDELIGISSVKDSNMPYVPQRISSLEPDKWKKELDPAQIEQIRKFVEPFGIPYYTEF